VTASFKASYAGIRQLMNSLEMQKVMGKVAEEVMARAVSAAPVYEGPPKAGVVPGEYKAAFHVETHANGGIHHDRAEALVINDSPHSVLVELPDEFHVLRDAVDELKALP